MAFTKALRLFLKNVIYLFLKVIQFIAFNTQYSQAVIKVGGNLGNNYTYTSL